MKSVLFATACVAVSLLFALPGAAQQAKQKGKKGNSPIDAVEKQIGGLTLTEEQQEKVKPILAEYRTKFSEAQNMSAAQLTKEQKTSQKEAREKGKTDGKKGKELQQEVASAVNLTEEQKAAQQEQAKQMTTLKSDLKTALAAVLTPEQVEQLPLEGKKKKK